MRKSRTPAAALAGAFTAALLIAAVPQPSQAAINYNASKSNTGNFTFNPTDPAALKKCKALSGKAAKQTNGTTLCIVPQKTATTTPTSSH